MPLISRNLRHLRLFAAVADLKSLTATSLALNISQPAVTQALGKLERESGGPLFTRTPHGFFLTDRGALLHHRIEAAFALLDPALADISPRLKMTLSYAQLLSLIAVGECENFTLAANKLGLAQPTVHRAVTQVELEAGRRLFERTSFGIIPSRACQAAIQAARLSMYELDQADVELAEFDGGEAGRIVIGAMPLARSTLLPRALSRFRQARPTYPVSILDGPYDELLGGLRRGAIDFLIGALREPLPIGDVVQQTLFHDRLALIAGPGHPLLGLETPRFVYLFFFPWVVPRRGTPAREQFRSLFTENGRDPPERIIESGSLLLMRELLADRQHLGCISRHQSEREAEHGLLAPLPFPTDHLVRPIGITTRQTWSPTKPQKLMLDLLSEVSTPATQHSQTL